MKTLKLKKSPKMNNSNFKIGDKVRVIATDHEISVFGGKFIKQAIEKSNMRITGIRDNDLIFDGFWLPENFCMVDQSLADVFKVKSESMLSDLTNQIKNIIIEDEISRTKKDWNETLDFDFDGEVLIVTTDHNHIALHFRSLLENEDFQEINMEVLKSTLRINVRLILLNIIGF